MSNSVEILQSARKKKGLSQEALAAQIGISHRMLQRYEEGKFPKYKSSVVKKIDQVLGTSLYELIYEPKAKESPANETISVAEHVAMLKDHNETLKKVILENLTTVQASLKTNQIIIRSIQVQQTAQHEIMLGSLDRLEKKKAGSLLAKAGRREFELNGQLHEIDKIAADDSMSR